jgi:hypothetical protein
MHRDEGFTVKLIYLLKKQYAECKAPCTLHPELRTRMPKPDKVCN